MKRISFLAAGALLVVAALPLLASTQAPLLPEHKAWLDMVDPIMTKTERQVFTQLTTNQERAKFIDFFWKQRDTTPDTAENEFQKEYMTRVRFADENFGYGTGKKGSLTERGWYYRLLGAPLERKMFTTESQVLPLELWFYQGDERFGLPPYFYLIFYQPMGMGEYRLYSPGVEGPEKLVIASMSEQELTRASAYQILHSLNSELGSASLSYLPGDRPQGGGSFASDSIVAQVRELPEKEFSDAYARNYLAYKDYIDTEYTDSFTESSFLVRVFRSGGANFLHWTLEPSRLNFAQRNDAYVASFELVLRIVDAAGHSVWEQDEEIPLKLSEGQYRAHERQRFAFQDLLPIIPGDYRVLFLLKNKTGKDFSSQEARVSVPRDGGPLGLGPMLLFRSKEPLPAAGGKPTVTAFAFEGSQFLFDTRNEFPKDSVLGVYVQPLNLAAAGAAPATLQVLTEVRSSDSNAVVWSAKHPLTEVMPAGHAGIEVQGLALAPLKAGYYEAALTVLDASDKPLASQKDHFILLTQAGTLLPWAYSRQRPAYPNPDFQAVLGSQYLAVGDYARAKDMLEASLSAKDTGPTRLLLARALCGQKAFKDSLALITPVYQATHDREAGKVLAQDYAGLEDWTSALTYLKELLQQATEVEVLNLTGRCLVRLNRGDEAVPLLRKSLELDAAQTEAKALLDEAQRPKK